MNSGNAFKHNTATGIQGHRTNVRDSRMASNFGFDACLRPNVLYFKRRTTVCKNGERNMRTNGTVHSVIICSRIEKSYRTLQVNRHTDVDSQIKTYHADRKLRLFDRYLWVNITVVTGDILRTTVAFSMDRLLVCICSESVFVSTLKG